MAIEVMAIEAVMSVEMVPRDCVTTESTVRATARVPTAEVPTTTEMPTTTAEVPTATAEVPTATAAAVSAATTAACVRRRATREDQDSDQRGQPN
jgi:hypothetical protein